MKDLNLEVKSNVIFQGQTCVFDEAGFEFQVKQPELALVRFEAKCSSIIGEDRFLSQYTLPFECIKPGMNI